MTNEPKISLAELGKVSNVLLGRVKYVNRVYLQKIEEHGQYASTSPAAVDADGAFGTRTVDPLLSYVNLEFAGALEHVGTLAEWGVSAASGARTPVFSPWSVARSAIEMLAVIAWLMEPSVEPRIRIARAFTLERMDAEGREGLGGSRDRNTVRVDEEADQLGLRKVARRNKGVGFEEERPSRTKLVRLLYGDRDEDFNFYSLLSAVSHGEMWAIVLLGFPDSARQEITGGYLLTKAPPALYLAGVLVRTERALQRAWDLTAAYRGW